MAILLIPVVVLVTSALTERTTDPPRVKTRSKFGFAAFLWAHHRLYPVDAAAVQTRLDAMAISVGDGRVTRVRSCRDCPMTQVDCVAENGEAYIVVLDLPNDTTSSLWLFGPILTFRRTAQNPIDGPPEAERPAP